MHGMLMDTTAQLKLRERPERRVVMKQRWEGLLFLHWEANPELIQATLPDGLKVDTYNDQAYLGVVPFFMRGVRPSFLPAVRGISDFMECNLRTYVVGPEGPGVWFYSLDCNQPLAVELARGFFHLSYYHSDMSAEWEKEDWVNYRCRRLYKSSLRHNEKTSHYRYRSDPEVKAGEVSAGSLEFFLIERYLLYSAKFKNNTLYSGRVWHEPYQVSCAQASLIEDHLIEVAGFNKLDRSPECKHYSAGVEVDIYGLKKC